MNISHQRCNYTMKKRCREWIVYEKTNMEKGRNGDWRLSIENLILQDVRIGVYLYYYNYL